MFSSYFTAATTETSPKDTNNKRKRKINNEEDKNSINIDNKREQTATTISKHKKKKKKNDKRAIGDSVSDNDSPTKKHDSNSNSGALNKASDSFGSPGRSDNKNTKNLNKSIKSNDKTTKRQDKDNKHHNVNKYKLNAEKSKNNQGGFKKNDNNNNGRRSFPNKPRVRPSPEALQLSQSLQVLSREKKMQEALDLYFSHSNAHLRDSHHACILVDCCARCGHVDQAERVVDSLLQQQHVNPSKTVNIFTYTALLKGYGLSGSMTKAMKIFKQLCNNDKNTTDPSDRTNVRTLNTVLRGCLWTAATQPTTTVAIASDKKLNSKSSKPPINNQKFVGGVISSEEAWQLFVDKIGSDQLDASSYEYSIHLLCQAQRLKEAINRIDELQSKFGVRVKGKATFVLQHQKDDKGNDDDDKSIMESISMVYLYLARAYALRGSIDETWSACQKSLSAAKMFTDYMDAQQQKSSQNQEASSDGQNCNSTVSHLSKNKMKQKLQQEKNQVAKGGKRAWSARTIESRREASNQAYRGHRMAEIIAEARDLCKLRNVISTSDLRIRVEQMSRRCLYFAGGGGLVDSVVSNSSSSNSSSSSMIESKERSSNHNKNGTNHISLTPIQSCWINFGFWNIFKHDGDDGIPGRDDILDRIGTNKIPLDTNGQLLLKNLFDKPDRPIDIELGAGFGDWIVHQANELHHHNHIAVEVRADRLHSILCKAVMFGKDKIPNLAIVGDTAQEFLSKRLKSNSISTIFVNHPEPPTQTFSDDPTVFDAIAKGGEEPVHMLTSQTFVTALDALKSNGQIVIVTDNRWYANLLCATITKANKVTKNTLHSFSEHEMRKGGFRMREKISNQVVLYEGQPNEVIGHAKASNNRGVSYFDRLWKTGAGGHSERVTRFVLALRRSERVP